LRRAHIGLRYRLIRRSKTLSMMLAVASMVGRCIRTTRAPSWRCKMQAFRNFGRLTENVRFERRTEASDWRTYLEKRAELIPETGSEVIKVEGTGS
jgi:hypothetical protein